jgi:hypothetical protein
MGDIGEFISARCLMSSDYLGTSLNGRCGGPSNGFPHNAPMGETSGRIIAARALIRLCKGGDQW